MDWGDVPTWVAAGATIGALIAAGWAVTRSGELLQVERDRDDDREKAEAERRERDERAEQADLVAAWPHLVHTTDVQIPDGAHTLVRMHAIRTGSGWGTLVANRSGLPVYDVEVELFGPDSSSRHTERRATLPPGEVFMRWPEDAIRFIAPEGELPEDWEPGVDEGDNDGGYSFGVAVSFRDTGGRSWKRTRFGTLNLTGRSVYLEAPEILAKVELTASGEVSTAPPADPEPG